MSGSVRPHRQQPTRLLCPWDSPGKNTGVGCHFLLQCMKEKSESEVIQLCPTVSDPMDCSPPGSSIHGFSRQEYWRGVPLPSLGLRQCGKLNRLLVRICRVKRDALSTGRPNYVRTITPAKATQLCHSRSYFLLILLDEGC